MLIPEGLTFEREDSLHGTGGPTVRGDWGGRKNKPLWLEVQSERFVQSRESSAKGSRIRRDVKGLRPGQGLLHEEVAGALVSVIGIRDGPGGLIGCRVHQALRLFVAVGVIVVLPGVAEAAVIPALFLVVGRTLAEPGVVRDRTRLLIEIAPASIRIRSADISDVAAGSR